MHILYCVLCPACKGRESTGCMWCNESQLVHPELAELHGVFSRLQSAWLRRQSPDWPATFAACMGSPMHVRLIIQEAERGDRIVQHRPEVRGHAEPSPDESSPVTQSDTLPVTKSPPIVRHVDPLTDFPPAPVGLDSKRRAAGERDDE